MSDVFVSYKAEDRARVALLVEALEADGLSVWWDAHLGGAAQWRDTIAHELDNARCVIVVWSKRSIGVEGHFVRDEATRALRRNAYLGLLIDKVDPPLGFGESQSLPLTGWKGDRSDQRYSAISAAVRNMIGMEPQRLLQAKPERSVSRRTLLIGGGSLVVAAVGGGWLLLKPDRTASDSIAVLPFANLSGDPGQAYFADGMAEEVRSALARIALLKVVARTSSEMMRDSDVKVAARKLDVANILTGSVRRSPSTIRVSAQLIDGRNGLELWSQSFDRPFGDVLQIQSGIATSVAEALSIHLGSKDRAALSLGGTKNASAQDLLMKARPGVNEDSEAGVRFALSLIDAAIALDPAYAEAHARKAMALNFYSGVYAHNAADAHARQSEAISAAERAVAIEPRLPLGYAALGSIYLNQLNLRDANEMLQRAQTLSDKDVRVMANYASLLSQMGRTADALRVIDQAVKLDPLDPSAQEVRTLVLYRGRKYREAVAYARHVLATSPRRRRTQGILALSLFLLGDIAEARRQIALLPPDDMRRLTGSAFIAARDGDPATANRFRTVAVLRYGDAAHYQYAQIDAQLGEKDRAFAELEKAWTQRDAGLASINVDPFLHTLKSDPRFGAIVKRLKFP